MWPRISGVTVRVARQKERTAAVARPAARGTTSCAPRRLGEQDWCGTTAAAAASDPAQASVPHPTRRAAPDSDSMIWCPPRSRAARPAADRGPGGPGRRRSRRSRQCRCPPPGPPSHSGTSEGVPRRTDSYPRTTQRVVISVLPLYAISRGSRRVGPGQAYAYLKDHVLTDPDTQGTSSRGRTSPTASGSPAFPSGGPAAARRQGPRAPGAQAPRTGRAADGS